MSGNIFQLLQISDIELKGVIADVLGIVIVNMSLLQLLDFIYSYRLYSVTYVGHAYLFTIYS